jgi:polyphosphate kinase 2 (PPK2 family)
MPEEDSARTSATGVKGLSSSSSSFPSSCVPATRRSKQDNIVLVKYWLAISKDEQIKRFNERKKIGFKRFKITAEDWRNRKKWHEYERAVCDMVDRSSTVGAPWTLVEANNKYHARIKVLRTLASAIEAGLRRIPA